MVDKISPLRLAVIFDQKISVGGGYQQALNAALLTLDVPSDICEPVFFTTLEENINTIASYGVRPNLIRLSFFGKIRTFLRRLAKNHRALKALKKIESSTPLEAQLIRHKIDLVYFLSPSSWARDLEKINYITTVWDLCHRDDPEFPEVRWNQKFEARERTYWAVLPRATAIFVDSVRGKKNVVHRYGIDDERVYVMPFQASPETRKSAASGTGSPIDIHAKYNLDVPYVFYPAQFWAHKNHVYLLQGLCALEQRYGLRIGAIFSGGDKGNLAYVKSYVCKLNLDDRVRFAGFVDNKEIPELYKQSVALVMPSYFGPTNLPPLEAFELGVPVLYPDKGGLRDQVGDAALLMNLNDPASMATHLNNLITDRHCRAQLIEAGKARLKYFDAMDRLAVLRRVLEDFRWRRLTWASANY